MTQKTSKTPPRYRFIIPLVLLLAIPTVAANHAQNHKEGCFLFDLNCGSSYIIGGLIYDPITCPNPLCRGTGSDRECDFRFHGYAEAHDWITSGSVSATIAGACSGVGETRSWTIGG